MKCESCSKDLLGTPSKTRRTKLVRVKAVETKVEGPDGMSSWIVAFSAFMINFIMAGLSRMSGILFVAFIEMFHTDRKGASMPFSVRSSTMNLLGPVVGVLGQKYGVRLISILGGVVGTLSAAACFFLDDITWITVIWGGFNGAGTALVTTLTAVMITQYFDEYRTTASGLSFSGACVGSFVFPPLMEWLLHAYGLEGSFLIVAGIIAHTIPAAMILRKPVWVKKANRLAKTHQEKEKVKPETIKVDANLSNDVELGFLRANGEAVANLLSLNFSKDKSQAEDIPSRDGILKEIEGVYRFVERNTVSLTLSAVPPKLQMLCETPPVTSKSRSVLTSWCSKTSAKDVKNIRKSESEEQAEESNPFVLPKLDLLRQKSESQVLSSFLDQALYKQVLKELRKLLKIHEAVKQQNVSVHSKPGFKVPPVQAKASKQKDPTGIWTNIKNSMKLHTNPLFLLVALCRAVHFTAFIPVVTIIVDYAMDKGFPEDEGKYVIAALSVGDLIGRLGLGWVTDRGYVSMPNYMLIVMVIQGLVTAMLPVVNGLFTFLPAVTVYAMLQGSVFVRHSVLLSNYMRKDEQSIASGCVNFLAGIMGFGVPAYVGFFRDSIGSYDGIFYVNGAVGAVAGLLWVFEPVFVKWAAPKKFISADELTV